MVRVSRHRIAACSLLLVLATSAASPLDWFSNLLGSSRTNDQGCDTSSELFICVNQSLTKIPSDLSRKVQHIVLDDNAIQVIELPTSYTSLQHLSLRRNQLGPMLIGKSPFEGLLCDILNITLSGNGITTITASYFGGLGKLDFLDLSNNQISNLSLPAINLLTRLNLANNNISRLDEALVMLANLERLNLAGNQIESVVASELYLPSMQYLSLRGNRISKIGSQAFVHMKNLVWLSLQDNKLKDINPESFAQLNKLDYLDLSENYFRTLNYPLVMAETAGSLKSLVVKNMPGMLTIGSSAMRKMFRLQYLNVTNNKRFSGVAQGALDYVGIADSRQLVIDFSNNAIESIDNVTYRRLPTYRSVNLTGNPWHCDCGDNVKWLIKVCSARPDRCGEDESLKATLTCASPPELFGRRLLRVNQSSLICDEHQAPPKSSRITRYVVAASLLALAVGMLAVFLTWWIGNYKKCRLAYSHKWGNGKGESVVYSLVRKRANVTDNPMRDAAVTGEHPVGV